MARGFGSINRSNFNLLSCCDYDLLDTLLTVPCRIFWAFSAFPFVKELALFTNGCCWRCLIGSICRISSIFWRFCFICRCIGWFSLICRLGLIGLICLISGRSSIVYRFRLICRFCLVGWLSLVGRLCLVRGSRCIVSRLCFICRFGIINWFSFVRGSSCIVCRFRLICWFGFISWCCLIIGIIFWRFCCILSRNQILLFLLFCLSFDLIIYLLISFSEPID